MQPEQLTNLDMPVENGAEPEPEDASIAEATAGDIDDKPMLDDDAEFEDDNVGKEKKITDDGGVVKKILVAGEGWDKPEAGDLVTVHYVGTLAEDGSKFDSSRDRGDPFTFTLGEGKVIKGWDKGVATMKKGEMAILTCRSDYAYGKAGSPPKIPADATLNFEVELLSWKSVKDITGDGGIIKTILVEGANWQKPEDKDEITVKFAAKVEGADAPFAQSPEEGVEFTVKDGHLCPGVTTAIKTMKKGEKAHLLLSPQYGFGEGGSAELGVPPNAKLEIELEAVSWKKVENVTDDGAVTRKVIKESEEWKRPNEGASVTIKYTARLLDGTVVDQNDALQFTTDEEHIIDGLEQALLKMKKGEVNEVTVAPQYAYGAKEQTLSSGTVPPNSTLIYHVELVDFENAKETWDMKDEEKVEAARAMKDKGNKAYKEGKLQRAVKAYDKAVNVINFDKNFADALKAECKEIKKSCWLNLAAAQLKAEKYGDVVKHCTRVLELDAGNVKALYRRAQAYVATQDYLEAEMDVKRALESEPSGADLLALQKRIKLLMREQNKKEASLYSKMFAAAANGKDAKHQKTELRDEEMKDQVAGEAVPSHAVVLDDTEMPAANGHA